MRKGYDAFDFKRVTRALIDFMVVELSAFYFDVRKDALYCDAPSSIRRKASIVVVRHLFDNLVTWLAPMLPFTTDEAWLARYPNAVSVHLEQFRDIPAEWKNEELAAKWRKVRQVRRVITGALEIERREKRIGSSLEAAPVVYVTDAELRARSPISTWPSLDHQRHHHPRQQCAGRRVHARRWRALPSYRPWRRAPVRPFLALYDGRGFRSGVPGRFGPRRCGTSRTEGARPPVDKSSARCPLRYGLAIG